MSRILLLPVLVALLLQCAARGQTPLPSDALPSDYILLTVFFKHDQSRSGEEINAQVEKQGFQREFPPDGIEIVSWYVMMGIGHVVTLRVPPARLREVNRIIERTAWGGYRTEFYVTYDLRAVQQARRDQARKRQ